MRQMMHIVADANIPCVEEAFRHVGEVTLLAGRAIGPEQVRDADLLLVRSVTPVDATLLMASRVRFVGSATIGVDHVDQVYLQTRGIAFAYAPGSSANSVAEYVVAALLALGEERYAGRSLGIIGLGRIGTLVKAKAEVLGMRVLANDPPVERSGGTGFVSLDTLLANSDVVTCHVPLATEGTDGTHHLLDKKKLGLLRPHAVVINTARGAVVDNAALLTALQGQCLAGAVLDVWEGEPIPDAMLMKAVTLGTPHIAGYSFDGKVNGTRMLYESACQFLKVTPSWHVTAGVSEQKLPTVHLTASDSLHNAFSQAVACAYDIRKDDAMLRGIAGLEQTERGKAFDRLRATYPKRMEFQNITVALPDSRPEWKIIFRRMGFTVV